MAQRELLPARIDPVVKQLIEKQARDLEASNGYVVEWMAAMAFSDKLPPGYRPGRRLIDED